MSLLRILHETTYRYKEPVAFGPHRLILRPREGHDIRVEELALEIEPEHALEWSRDLFGNSVATVHFLKPAPVLRIRNRVILRQTTPFALRRVQAVKSAPFPLQFTPVERAMAEAYQTLTFPEHGEAIADWVAAEMRTVTVTDAESVVTALNGRIHDMMSYKRREDKGVQTPLETLRTRLGSCRDMATLMMEALRVLGFPMRFASGYLDCRASEAGRASTHAWAEAYLPETGWIGYDPTLGERTGAKHVVTGVSNHPRGVMPITGSFFGDAELYEDMTVTVQTERLSQGLGSWPEHAPVFLA